MDGSIGSQLSIIIRKSPTLCIPIPIAIYMSLISWSCRHHHAGSVVGYNMQPSQVWTSHKQGEAVGSERGGRGIWEGEVVGFERGSRGIWEGRPWDLRGEAVGSRRGRPWDLRGEAVGSGRGRPSDLRGEALGSGRRGRGIWEGGSL